MHIEEYRDSWKHSDTYDGMIEIFKNIYIMYILQDILKFQ